MLKIRVLAAVILLAVGSSIGATSINQKIMPYSQAQIESIQKSVIASCIRDAEKEDGSPAKECESDKLALISDWVDGYHRSDVTAITWNRCYWSSGAKLTGDIAAWESCIVENESDEP